MHDVSVQLADRPGALAAMGAALGRAGISIEGGGAWTVNGTGCAHFLFDDGHHARRVLEQADIDVLAVREVLVRKLKQDQPGQLGAVTQRLADAGVNILVLYSDHANRLILVVDDVDKGRDATAAWTP